MKKIVALMIVALSLALTGCSEVEEKISDKSEFVIVEGTSSWYIVYHKKTKVMYAVSQGAYNGGTFTLLVNADGTPMLWEGE
jgi:starvation-inducible outer membrane lipoprotein